MALNYSHRPVFPPHVSEDNLVAPLRIANGYFMDGGDPAGSQQSPSDDIVHLLPSDPFGMDIQTTFTALTGWLEDLEFDYGGYVGTNNCRPTQECPGLFAGWNMFCNNSCMFHPSSNPIPGSEILNLGSFPSSFQASEMHPASRNCIYSSVNLDETLQAACSSEERSMLARLASVENGFQEPHDLGVAGNFSNGRASCYSKPGSSQEVNSTSGLEDLPKEALGYLLTNLGLKDVLSLEMTSKSLFTTIRHDPFLWDIIHIDRPLNERITDDDLAKLVNLACGSLKCLSLVECPKISEDCLRQIVETNPQLTKLAVPGCTRISIECILNIMRAHKSNRCTGGIKRLRIGGLYGVNHTHFEELMLLLGVNEKKLDGDHDPLFYHRDNFYLPQDDDRAMDIEMCPKCEKFRLLYDCPAEGCKVKDKSPQVCRACIFCVSRCGECGRCINNTEFEETFCLELLCSSCFKKPREEGQEG